MRVTEADGHIPSVNEARLYEDVSAARVHGEWRGGFLVRNTNGTMFSFLAFICS